MIDPTRSLMSAKKRCILNVHLDELIPRKRSGLRRFGIDTVPHAARSFSNMMPLSRDRSTVRSSRAWPRVRPRCELTNTAAWSHRLLQADEPLRD